MVSVRLILVGVAACLVTGPLTGQTVDHPLTDAQRLELKTYTGQLADPARSAKTKSEAASLLLTRTYPQATRALLQFLKDSSNQSARVAIATAIGAQGSSDRAFIDPLIAMLTGKDAAVRSAAARALVTYKNHGVTDKLVAIALDAQQDKAVRLVTIKAMESVLDKRAVDALVRLLDDSDPAIRDGSMAALAALTNIRAFGKDQLQWKLWWQRNRHKPRSQWLADLADSLAWSKASLEADNARLRQRLSRAMTDLYQATPEPQREAALVGFLKDPLVEVRLVGLALADRRISAGKKLWPAVVAHAPVMLQDPDPGVRRAAALLTAHVGDGKALATLMARLKTEKVPEVRQGLLTAMGSLRNPKVLPVVLEAMTSKYEKTVIAAAGALARIASDQPLDGQHRAAAVKALLERYALADKANNGAALREALVAAMGTLKDARIIGVLVGALKDPAATVRLAAVNALTAQRSEASAESIAPLVGDGDRGVRRAAIAALGSLGGRKYLETILQRTRPEAEPDAAVRDQAWGVAMDVLGTADVATLTRTAESLADRADATEKRIKVLEMLAAALEAAKSPKLTQAWRRLGADLVTAGRPAEAAACLEKAYQKLLGDGNSEATVVWQEWVQALLLADDATVVKAMAGQKDDRAFRQALAAFQKRLAALNAVGKFATVALLSQEAVGGLAGRLTADELQRLKSLLTMASARQRQADGVRVEKLLSQMVGGDEAGARTASAELRSMGDRAVEPLLTALKKALVEDKPNAEAERVIIDALSKLAPDLKGYDTKAPQTDRLKRVESWLAARQP